MGRPCGAFGGSLRKPGGKENVSVTRHTPALYDSVASPEQTARAVTEPNQRTLLILSAVTVAWVGTWIWLTRYYLLDDAFIHLRLRIIFAPADFSLSTGPSRAEAPPAC